MNKIVNRFLLAGDKFMFEMHLKQPGFIYSACGSFTRNKERIQKFKETGDTSYIYKNEHDKTGLSVCSCHVTYAFQSESTLYSCLNVKELLARSRREI